MLKKQRDIEQDFKLYDVDKCSKRSRALNMVIQVLVILLLLSLLGLIVLYGYKYVSQDKRADKIQQNGVESQKAISVVSVSKPVVSQKEEGEKLYTQTEMQMIVRALMKEIEKKEKERNKEEQKPKEEKADIKKQTAVMTVKEENESGEESLLSALEQAGADQIEDIKREIPSTGAKTKAMQKASTIRATRTPNIYNKVVVRPSTNTYDDLAKLSNEISSVVKEMKKTTLSQKPVYEQKYEEIINEEINTRENEMRIIVVREGDTLSKIAQRAYGDLLAYDKIIEANPELIENPDRIYVGQKLRVPKAE